VRPGCQHIQRRIRPDGRVPVPVLRSKSLFGDKSLSVQAGPEGSNHDFVYFIWFGRRSLWKVPRAHLNAQAFELLYKGRFLWFGHRFDYIANRLSNAYLLILPKPFGK
jgi:hypothetical protein